MTDFSYPHASGVAVEGTFIPDKLYDRFSVRRKVTIAQGAAYQRGTLMGKVTATGKWVVSTAAATDGSQDPRGVLLHDADATAGDVEAIVGRVGRCSKSAVILGAGHTLASVDDALIDRGIILETSIG